MGQQEELAAVLKPPAGMVFSWEPVAVISTKPAAVEARGDTIVMPPGSPTKKAAAAPPARRLSVPPPPGRTATRSLSSRGASGRAVRPEDDPFLAAYLACTKSTKGGRDAGGTPGEANKQGRSRFTWARLWLSCKSSAGVVERSMMKVAKRPELDPRDA